MMALDIEAIADERSNYPNESRDELVARYTEAALYSLHAIGKDMPTEKVVQFAGRLVDYVEAHSGSAPAQIKREFTADCAADRLP